MNREIKFRMWNNVEGNPEASRMFYDIEQVMACLTQQMTFDSGLTFGYNHVGDGNAFMQFTGIINKKGVEIYEGDIVQLPRYSFYHVVCWNPTYSRFDLKYPSNARTDFIPIDNTRVGNIYETPELLK